MDNNSQAKSRSGEQCKARAVDNGLCAFHRDPVLAGERTGRVGRHAAVYCLSEALTLQPPTSACEVRQLLGKTIADLLARRRTRIISG